MTDFGAILERLLEEINSPQDPCLSLDRGFSLRPKVGLLGDNKPLYQIDGSIEDRFGKAYCLHRFSEYRDPVPILEDLVGF